jgi:hypothetical protein
MKASFKSRRMSRSCSYIVLPLIVSIILNLYRSKCLIPLESSDHELQKYLSSSSVEKIQFYPHLMEKSGKHIRKASTLDSVSKLHQITSILRIIFVKYQPLEDHVRVCRIDSKSGSEHSRFGGL